MHGQFFDPMEAEAATHLSKFAGHGAVGKRYLLRTTGVLNTDIYMCVCVCVCVCVPYILYRRAVP